MNGAERSCYRYGIIDDIAMKKSYPFRIDLSGTGRDIDVIQRLEHFALLNLGMVQSLGAGILGGTEAIQRFYHADNCLYVRKHLRNRHANAIVGHGIQLPDLFDSLPAEEAQREFLHELETMSSLCLMLLKKVRSPDSAGRAQA